MRIVIIGDFPHTPTEVKGGVEAVILYLVEGLQRYGDLELQVVTLDPQGTSKRRLQHQNATIHYVPLVRLPSRLSIIGNIRRLRAEILRLEPDLVHAQIAGEYAEAAASTGLPWVLTLHGIRFLEAELRAGFLNRTYRGWFIKREEFRAVRQATHIISISPFIQTTFAGHIRGQIHDIENPIAEAFFKLPPLGKPGHLLFVGRLIPRKGVHTLLHAFAELHRRLPEVKLRLAGGGIHPSDSTSYYYELKQYVDRAGLNGSVAFLGELNEAEILQEYADCSALVLSSVLETAPMVIMQAMAAGKPVVATDAGGSRYLVKDGDTGLVVPPNNPSALAEALYRVLSDGETSQAMGRRGREVANRRFRARVVAAQTREVYYSILGQTPPETSS